MRILIAAVAFLLAWAIPAGAETRIFIIENQPDDYGVDKCLARGAICGKPVASAYCVSRKYLQAVSFRKIDPDEITGGSITNGSCRTRGCGEFVAIECSR
jgi:hypothetical protein